MDLGLTDRVVLVVGGNGLIGSAVVTRLREEGATVIVVSRSGRDGICMDATDDDAVSGAVADLLREHHRLDAVVVTAAPSARTLDPARSADPRQVIDATDAKAMSFLRVANAAIPPMVQAGYGRIVGVSGQNAFVTGSVTGSIRNAALIIAAKNLADSVAGSGVTVNTVSPGVVTPTPSSDVKPASPGESSPDQIADLIAFLVSPRSAAVSGESIATGHRVRGVVSF